MFRRLVDRSFTRLDCFREHSLDTQVQRYSYASAPLIFIGNGIKPEIIHAPVKIGNIAPTVAHYMRIRAP